jgi:imidazolonepropionase-like amidohydrolase
MRRAALSLLFPIILTTGSLGMAQEGGKPPEAKVIKAGRLIDVRAGRVLTDRAILVEGERIKSVGETAEILKAAPKDASVIDLSSATVLSGLIDCHTHVLLQGDITAADYDEQLLKESIPYRTIRVTVYVAQGRAAAGNRIWKEMLDLERKAFSLAVRKRARIAYGTDAGGYLCTENQAKEFWVTFGLRTEFGRLGGRCIRHHLGWHRRGGT